MNKPPAKNRSHKAAKSKDRGAELGALRFKERAAKRKLLAVDPVVETKFETQSPTQSPTQAIESNAAPKPQKAVGSKPKFGGANTRRASVRTAAARAIASVWYGHRSLRECLPEADAELPDPRDRALLRVIVQGAMRQRFALEDQLLMLVDKPLPAKQQLAHAALLSALYQINEEIGPPHAIVDETVDAMRALNQGQLVGLANAVLRRRLREGFTSAEKLAKSERTRFNHPAWLIDALKADWPKYWQQILLANNVQAQPCLRVNRRFWSRAQALETLRATQFEMDIKPLPMSVNYPFGGAVSTMEQNAGSNAIELPDALWPERLSDPTHLPKFVEGALSVQDGAAQLAVELLDLKPGMRVLDACAAPGGKAAHIMEREPSARLLALDVDAKRAAQMQSNFARLGLQIEVKVADAVDPVSWLAFEDASTLPANNMRFDRILLDAPCSATGVIRRHPDIRWLRKKTDIATLCAQQARLLDALWPLLEAGGRLVYATCSMLKAENEAQVTAFLQRTPDARLCDAVPAWFGVACEAGRQNFPGQNGMDGFYYAVLERAS